MEKTIPLEFITAEELFARPYEEPKWIVEEMFGPGLYILGGSPKVGKSWFSLQLSKAVCEGSEFLGHAARKSSVLYLCLEDHYNRMNGRMKQTYRNAPHGMLLSNKVEALGRGCEDQLRFMLDREPSLRLIIVDTLQKIRETDNSPNRYEADYREMSMLKAVADEYEVCILAVHHLRKQGDPDPLNRLSGSTGLTGCADGTMVLERKREEAEGTLFLTGRDIEDDKLSLVFTGTRWEQEEAVQGMLVMLDSVVQAVKCYLEKAGPFEGTAARLSEALEPYMEFAMSASRLSKHLSNHEKELYAEGITLSRSRNSVARRLRLEFIRWDESEENDGCDTNDGADRSGSDDGSAVPSGVQAAS